MKKFKRPADFAKHLIKIANSLEAAQISALKMAGKTLKKETKELLGNYQIGEGPFISWEPLKEFTKKDRLNKGFTENDPLKRRGDLQDSIKMTLAPPHTVVVGSSLKKAIVMEKGNDKVPARSFFGIAAARLSHSLAHSMCDIVVSHLASQKVNTTIKE